MKLPVQLLLLACLTNSQQVNDACVDAIPIGDGPIVGDTTGATVEDPLTSDYSGCSAYFSDVWYLYTASCTGVVQANVSGTCDLVLATWTGNCSGFSANDCQNRQAANGIEQFFFPVVDSSTYYVSVGAYSAIAACPFRLTTSCITPPLNDNCGGAVMVGDGIQAFDNFGASSSTSVACSGAYENDVWFTYNATCQGLVTASITHNEDLVIVAWTNSTCGSAGSTCGDQGEEGEPDFVTFPAVLGKTTRLSVGGYSNADRALFDLNISCGPLPPAPANDNCAGALDVLDGGAVSSMALATKSTNSNYLCTGAKADVWFTYTATCTGTATMLVDPTNPGDDILVQHWYGNCTTKTADICVDSGAPTETIMFVVAIDEVHYFSVDSKTTPPYSGAISIYIGCDPATTPVNDNCTGAAVLSDGSTRTDNMGATDSNANVTGCPGNRSDIWYRYVATCSGSLQVSLQARGDVALASWTGSTCPTLQSGQCAHGLSPAVQLMVSLNSVYYFSVAAYAGFRGQITLLTTCTASAAPTPYPSPITATPTPRFCPSLVDFSGNCSAENFTENRQCSGPCKGVAGAVFDGFNLTLAQKSYCFTELNATVNSTWTPGVAVLVSRLEQGQPLCRSASSVLSLSWSLLVCVLVSSGLLGF